MGLDAWVIFASEGHADKAIQAEHSWELPQPHRKVHKPWGQIILMQNMRPKVTGFVLVVLQWSMSDIKLSVMDCD